MTEGAIIQGSSPAMRRNSQSANLAEALSTIVDTNSQIQTDCNNNCDSDENLTGFIDDLGRRLQSTSSEIVVRQLIARDTDGLAGLRDRVLQLVRSKWSCCPKGELQRRITRTRGTSASEKLAQDIVLLVKFYESGEGSQALKDIFRKVRNTDCSYALGDKETNAFDQPNLKKLLEIVEDLEAKFVETNIQHKTDIDKLKDELNHMQLHLAEKDSKIYSLEKEVSTLRANCRASKESLNSKCESICVEMENISKMAEQRKSKESIKILTKKNLNNSVEFGNTELAHPGPKGAVNNGTQPRSFAAVASGSNEDNEQVTIVSVIDCEQSEGQINTVLVNDDDSNKGESANDPEPPSNNTDCPKQSQVIRSSKTSENQNEASLVDSKEFIGVERRNTKRLYLGGVKDGVHASTIKEFMQGKGVQPTFVRMMKSRRSGTVAVRINVRASDIKEILEPNFWPKNVYAREWLSKDKWEKRSVKSDRDPSREPPS
ncbi:Hypothetical predicted protein [Paramuricea clavata]|uniref:Uncharacterized protein n=1 Tax=Paramuricea clavata TaxID=317549 RepID=A0A7D9HPW2_PARCT|nr:Hypothetical predicted protein [Paramuricea clavata]